MALLSLRIITTGALNGWLLFASAAALNSSSPYASPSAGQAWTAPLAADAVLDLAWIPPGTFTQGSPADEPGRHADEGPAMEVTLAQGFWLGKTMVTIGQWKDLMGLDVKQQLKKALHDDTLYDFDGKPQTLRDFMHWQKEADPTRYLGNEDDDLPMYFVSWTDAMEFARRLNLRFADRLPAGYAFSLPTEARWEYACRAGSTTPTYAGASSPEVLDKIAWYGKNSADDYHGRPVAPSHSGPRKVAQKQANAWGLYDMQGNIWQWCADWYGPYPGGQVKDPTGPATGTARVNRGGSFGSGPNSERSAGRASNPQSEASAYRGFRIALVPIAHNH